MLLANYQTAIKNFIFISSSFILAVTYIFFNIILKNISPYDIIILTIKRKKYIYILYKLQYTFKQPIIIP